LFPQTPEAVPSQDVDGERFETILLLWEEKRKADSSAPRVRSGGGMTRAKAFDRGGNELKRS